MNQAVYAEQLTRLLNLSHAPVGVTFDAPDAETGATMEPQPAGCCFWSPAQSQRLDTDASDHANCSVGSYTHGLIPLEQAAGGSDTEALLGSGWVAEQDLMSAAALPFKPGSITYEPLVSSTNPAVVLVQLSASSLMTLLGAVPDLFLARKPQCVIVPLAAAGTIAVSPGCAVSRTRTGLPGDAMTCAIPASEVPAIIQRLETTTAADRTVSEFAAADMAANFSPA